MSKIFPTLPAPIKALTGALVLVLLLLAACSTGSELPVAASPSAASTEAPDFTESIMSTSEPVPAGTPTSRAAEGFDCSAVDQIPTSECQALVALYESTAGPDWADNSGWLVTNTPCAWTGISCSDGHVVHLSLLYNQLSGTLPPELSDLSRLQVIEMWVNELRGSIPPEWGKLSELFSLDLSANQLSGRLPAELGNLKKLEFLALYGNQLNGSIPPALGQLANLEVLNLAQNRFSGSIPEELGGLSNLSRLDLSHNQLSGTIPQAFNNLGWLGDLDLRYNQLRGPLPDSLSRILQRALWGNLLDGTVTADDQGTFIVDYLGVGFEADQALAGSIWPELIPANPVSPEGPFWVGAPEHIRFTFADAHSQPRQLPMGINLAAEAQIFIYPLAELGATAPYVHEQIERLQELLLEEGPVPAGELPLLPLNNAAQVFHAQVSTLDSEALKGIRFLTQHSQDLRPIVNGELTYTFQGITSDGAYYVAAFFPVTTDVLPDKVEVEDWEAFSLNYARLVSETTAMLDDLSAAAFSPGLISLDEVITSLRIDTENGLVAGASAAGTLPHFAPPAGIVYKTAGGLWQTKESGAPLLLTAHGEALPSPDAAHAVYMDEQNLLWLIDFRDNSETQLAQGYSLSPLFQWGNNRTLLLGLQLSPLDGEGGAMSHAALLDTGTGKIDIIDQHHLSFGYPALAPDGATVAYDVSPFYSNVVPDGYVYHADSEAQPLNLAAFAGMEEMQAVHFYNPAWSPDGAGIVWLVGSEAGTTLTLFDLVRQTAVPLLTWQPVQFGALPPAPVWSPDGQALAIETWSNTGQESGFWLLPAGGSGAQRVSATISSAALGSSPVWLSSRELIYVACDENHNNCENRLYDLLSDTTAVLDLPPGSVVMSTLSSE